MVLWITRRHSKGRRRAYGTPKREKLLRAERNLVRAISTWIAMRILCQATTLFSSALFFFFKFKTSLVAHLGTRALFGDRTRRGLYAITLSSALRGRWQFLARSVLYGRGDRCVASSSSSFFLFFLPSYLFRVASGLNQLRKERVPLVASHKLFYRIFTDHAAKHSFRFAIIPQLSPPPLLLHRFISGYFALSFSLHVRRQRNTANAPSVHFYFGRSV